VLLRRALLPAFRHGREPFCRFVHDILPGFQVALAALGSSSWCWRRAGQSEQQDDASNPR